MPVVGSLTIVRVNRQTLSNRRDLPPTEHTDYIQPDRRREEHRGYFGYRVRRNGRDLYRPTPHTALIRRGDLKLIFHVNFDDRQYVASPMTDVARFEEMAARAAAAGPQPRREPTVLVETETVDTAERKDFFGHRARHVIITRRVTPLDGAKHTTAQRTTVTDGWFIDLDTHISCDPWWRHRTGHAFLQTYRQGEEPDVPTFKDVGELELGFAVQLKNTYDDSSSWAMEITRLSTEEIDPALFEVPKGFQLVEQIRQEPKPPLAIRLKQLYDRARGLITNARRRTR
jgi:hypothetical protein